MILFDSTYHSNSTTRIKQILYYCSKMPIGRYSNRFIVPSLASQFLGKVLACDSIDSLREIAECLSGGPSGEDAAAGDDLV